MKTWLLTGALALATMAGPATAQGVPVDPQDTSGLRKVGAEVLFWSQKQRDANFPHMEKIFPGHVVKAGGKVRALPTGKPLPFPDAELDAFIAAQHISGLIVLQDGKSGSNAMPAAMAGKGAGPASRSPNRSPRRSSARRSATAISNRSTSR
jgi:hypothetical protein